MGISQGGDRGGRRGAFSELAGILIYFDGNQCSQDQLIRGQEFMFVLFSETMFVKKRLEWTGVRKGLSLQNVISDIYYPYYHVPEYSNFLHPVLHVPSPCPASATPTLWSRPDT